MLLEQEGETARVELGLSGLLGSLIILFCLSWLDFTVSVLLEQGIVPELDGCFVLREQELCVVGAGGGFALDLIVLLENLSWT